MLVSEILSVIKNDNILISYLAEIPKKYQKTQVQLLSALDRLGYTINFFLYHSLISSKSCS